MNSPIPSLTLKSASWTASHHKSCQGQPTYAQLLLNALKMSAATVSALKNSLVPHFHIKALENDHIYYQELQSPTWFMPSLLQNKQKIHLRRPLTGDGVYIAGSLYMKPFMNAKAQAKAPSQPGSTHILNRRGQNKCHGAELQGKQLYFRSIGAGQESEIGKLSTTKAEFGLRPHKFI